MNTLTFGTPKEGITSWPSGKHLADWMIHDGAIVIAISLATLSTSALEDLIRLAHKELADHGANRWRACAGSLEVMVDLSGATNEALEEMISMARGSIASRKAKSP